MDHRFLWKGGIQPSDIYHWLSAVCGEKAPACSTCSAGYRALTQAVVYKYYYSTRKELFSEAILGTQGDGSDVQV